MWLYRFLNLLLFIKGAWGKRAAPEDDYALQQLLGWLEEQQQSNDNSPADYIAEMETEPNNEVKRAWKQFSDGWGKRADSWKNFRGSLLVNRIYLYTLILIGNF